MLAYIEYFSNLCNCRILHVFSTKGVKTKKNKKKAKKEMKKERNKEKEAKRKKRIKKLLLRKINLNLIILLSYLYIILTSFSLVLNFLKNSSKCFCISL